MKTFTPYINSKQCKKRGLHSNLASRGQEKERRESKKIEERTKEEKRRQERTEGRERLQSTSCRGKGEGIKGIVLYYIVPYCTYVPSSPGLSSSESTLPLLQAWPASLSLAQAIR